jgi:hypothetical protein
MSTVGEAVVTSPSTVHAGGYEQLLLLCRLASLGARADLNLQFLDDAHRLYVHHHLL